MAEQYKGYSIVRLDADKIIHIQSLSKAVWGKASDLKSLYLKYYHQEEEHAFLGYLALDEAGNAAGFQGASRLEIAYQDQTEVIAQSCDTMTHPAHQGKGLYYYLANKTYQLCKEKGMKMVMGYPNQNSLVVVTQKFGFKIIDYLRAYHISIPTIPLESIFEKLSLFKKIHTLYCDFIFSFYKIPYKIPYSFDRNSYPIFLRENSITTYKQARGVFSLQIENTILWLKINHGLLIGDLQCPNEEEFLRIMKKLTQLCFFAGIRSIHFQSNRGSKEADYFEKHYPSFQAFSVCYLDFGTDFPMEKCKSTFGDIDIF